MIIIKFKEIDLDGWDQHFKKMNDLINDLPELPTLEVQLGKSPTNLQIQEAHYLVNMIDSKVTHISQMSIALLEYIEGWIVLRKAELMDEALQLKEKYKASDDRKAYTDNKMKSEKWEERKRAAKMYREIIRKEHGRTTRQKEQLGRLTWDGP